MHACLLGLIHCQLERSSHYATYVPRLAITIQWYNCCDAFHDISHIVLDRLVHIVIAASQAHHIMYEHHIKYVPTHPYVCKCNGTYTSQYPMVNECQNTILQLQMQNTVSI